LVRRGSKNTDSHKSLFIAFKHPKKSYYLESQNHCAIFTFAFETPAEILSLYEIVFPGRAYDTWGMLMYEIPW
jgi:hypothetical protein